LILAGRSPDPKEPTSKEKEGRGRERKEKGGKGEGVGKEKRPSTCFYLASTLSFMH